MIVGEAGRGVNAETAMADMKEYDFVPLKDQVTARLARRAR